MDEVAGNSFLGLSENKGSQNRGGLAQAIFALGGDTVGEINL